MSQSLRRILPLFALGSALLASAEAKAQTVTHEQPVVYGDDDRVEVADHPDADVQNLARGAIVTLMPKAIVSQADPDDVQLRGPTLQTSQNLCAGEAFAEQPASGFCSGTLIGPDLVLTAGHCMANGEASCSQTSVVFGFHYDNGLETITSDQVFWCSAVIAYAQDDGDKKRDYSIIQLDRPATNQTPAAVAAEFPNLRAGDPLLMIGSPSGIPVKIEDGGAVRDPRSSVGDYFVGTTDSFAGNSGSGVFDPDTLELIGILVEGDTDYVENGSCNIVNRCSDSGCDGENILYARGAIEDFCSRATDVDLCGTPSQCGDGYCAFDENVDSCSDDCSGPVCGDGKCSANEVFDCPGDCVVVVPDEWTCSPDYYGVLDGCDCNCGAYDPDCEGGTQQVLNCDLFETCDTAGQCVTDPGCLCDSGPEGTWIGLSGMALGLAGLLLVRRRQLTVVHR